MGAPLEGIRVVDVATYHGEFCGRILADLGAEVVKVEPPRGCESRHHGPTPGGNLGHDTPTDEQASTSLYWVAYGRGKKSVVLDFDSETGLERLRALVDTADVFIESWRPGHAETVGLGPEQLTARNPALIYSSITPFGRSGPKADWDASNLIVEAAGGRLAMQGDGDRPPIPMGYMQGGFQGSGAAATDIVTALYERDRSGLGQVLDTSMQIATIWTLMHATSYAAVGGPDPSSTDQRRSAPPAECAPGVTFPGTEAVVDGWVVITPPVLGAVTIDSFTKLMGWVAEADMLDADLCDIEWGQFLTRMRTGDMTPDQIGRGITQLRSWLATQTKADLHQRALADRVLVAPAQTTADLLADPQLNARDFWIDPPSREGVPLRQAGAWGILSETPLAALEPAPSLGQHQALLGSTHTPAVPAKPDRPGRGPILGGLNVADFTWAGVGPYIAKHLGDHGATVVKVESVAKPDNMRFIPPYVDGAPPLENNHPSPNFNTNKLSLGTNLSTPDGKAIARDLVAWADVVVENMTPGVMDRLGVGYEQLAPDRPDLIMLSTSLRGQTGPERLYTGFGQQGAALSGFLAITGWPDRPPKGPSGPYTDFATPRVAIAALMAAIRHRHHTGVGQFLDISQIEATTHFLEPLVLDHQANGWVHQADGLDLRAQPDEGGVYAVLGDERYVAVDVSEVDPDWHWGVDTRAWFRTLSPLLGQNSGDRPAAMAQWCATRTAEEAVGELRALGVAAHVVARPSDMSADPQLRHRNFFVPLDHPTIGRLEFDGPATIYSATPPHLFDAGPTIGQHTDDVLGDLLGYAPERIGQLRSLGVLA